MSSGKRLDSRIAVRFSYDMHKAPKGHAESIMRELGRHVGFTVIGSTPQSLGDCWWFWVVFNSSEVGAIELPDYVSALPWAEVGSV